MARIRGAKVVTYCSARCADTPIASGKVTTRRTPAPPEHSDLTPVPKAHVSHAPRIEIDLTPAPTPVKPRLSASLRKRVLWISAAIMLGGMAIAAILSFSPSTPSSVSAGHLEPPSSPSTIPAKATAEASTTAVPTTSKDLRTRSIEELEHHLAGDSPRFQRLAGMALARISHPGATKTLLALLQNEKSDLSRIDIAYGLALANEQSGRTYLVAELASKRRDVRIDAARRLVQLGDDSGRKALHQMLGVRTHRLGAASVLALLEDDKGLEVLRATFKDPKSSDENRMRAAVGLGWAGEVVARAHLLEILREGKFVVDAAGALATLGDAAAVPALERQLELTALRVGAAENLRTMKVDVDTTSLASALAKSNAEGRIAAAEAILVLGQ